MLRAGGGGVVVVLRIKTKTQSPQILRFALEFSTDLIVSRLSSSKIVCIINLVISS